MVAACGGGLRRFPDAEPMWRDPDEQPFSPRPKKYVSPEIWDTVDNLAFEPLTRILAVDVTQPAVNVNAVDEVPDSSWFVNRIGRRDLSRDELVRGACPDAVLDPTGPWKVVSGKPNGANPGFLIEAQDGRKYLLKFDGTFAPERASAGDVIGSLVYHAAGYHVPCNQVVYFDPKILAIEPGATAEDFVGDEVPLTPKMLAAALEKAVALPDGRLRAGASLLLSGKPLGPWKDHGTRDDDPNDVIPHEDRRELRGSQIFAAWLDHYDAREQNSLDVWIEADGAGGRGFIRHFMIDFGDCLGSMSAYPRVSRRRGHAYEVEWGVFLAELVTFGMEDRPWHHAREGAGGRVLGYFDADRFVPDRWRTAYPYGPFTRMTEADAAWAARILARFSPEDVEVLVGAAQIQNAAVRAELIRVLTGRREKLLRRYLLGRLTPLSDPRVEGRKLCLRDSALEAGLTGAERLALRVKNATVAPSAAPDVCVTVPAQGEYVVVEIARGPLAPVKVHLRDTSRGLRVVGLERD